jgi:indoleamine 2,3-dioxygenase
MFEKCDPAVFYWKIRKFLAGSENMASLGLPNGLEYKGVNNNERKHYMGATAGQSSLFPALDLFFGIEHYDENPSQPEKSPNALLLKMRAFMPGAHRAFLDHLAKVANLRAYVLSKEKLTSSSDDQVKDLLTTYDECVQQIKLFRDTHIQIVTKYILVQAKRGPPEGWEDYRVQVAVATTATTNDHASTTKEEDGNDDETPAIQGTGGSDLMPFLKTNRDETNAAKFNQP